MFAVKDQPHVKASVHARHQRPTQVDTEGDLTMLALVLSTTCSSELTATHRHRLVVVVTILITNVE